MACGTATLGLAMALSISAGCGGAEAPTAPTTSPPSGSNPVPATATVVRVATPTPDIRVGDAAVATAVAEYSDGTSQDVTGAAVWTTSNPLVLAVSAPGRATAVGTGTAALRASYQERVSAAAFNVSAGARSTADRPDDFGGAQIKVVYVVPSDRPDRQLDADGTIARSVDVAQEWLLKDTEGYRFRLDTFGGRLDVAGVILDASDAEMMSNGSRQRDALEREMMRRGFNVPGKVYVAYYDGGHQRVCADSFQPPGLLGNLAAIYLHGTPPGARPCDTNPFATTAGFPGYLEFIFTHEVFHAMGLVANCAPNSGGDGHVRDDTTDLMYAGSLPWAPARVDVGRNDYFLHGRATCADAANSPYLTR